MTKVQVNSPSKSILIGIYSFLIAANVFGAISSLVYLGGLQVGPFIVSLLIQGLLLTAVIKQWRFFLRIWRILTIIVIVIMSIVSVLGIVFLIGSKQLDDESKTSLFVFEIVLILGILLNSILAHLIGRYTDDLKRAIIVACNF